MHFIPGLVAAFNLSARCRSCCKLAENGLHTGEQLQPFSIHFSPTPWPGLGA